MIYRYSLLLSILLNNSITSSHFHKSVTALGSCNPVLSMSLQLYNKFRHQGLYNVDKDDHYEVYDTTYPFRLAGNGFQHEILLAMNRQSFKKLEGSKYGFQDK